MRLARTTYRMLDQQRFWWFARRAYRLGNRRKMAGDFVRTWLGQQKYAYSYFSQALRVRFSRKHALQPPHRQRELAIVN